MITDPGIPTLANAVTPALLGEWLPQVLPSEWGAIRDIRLQVLKHHPGKRCTVDITLGTTHEQYSVIGKIYATDRSDVYEGMERIRGAGFGQDQEFSIPRPLGYSPELRLLLQEKVEGLRAKTIFLEGSERDRAVAAERCAQWLARFHAHAPTMGPVFGTDAHLASMAQWTRGVAEVAEASAEKAARLFDRLEAAASRLSRVEMCAGHGAYNCSQIILTNDRTITFDWDSYDVADPSRDVARFVVDLERLAFKYLGSMRALDGVGEIFLKTYVATGRTDVVGRLAFQKATICLKHAEHDVHGQIPGWPQRVEATLDEGLRVLEEGMQVN